MQYHLKRGQMPPPYYDDVEENAIDIINRVLLANMLKRAVKNGDGEGIRALKLVCIPFFLGRDEKQNSKYAMYLLKEHVDHEGCDSLTKERKDQYATVNTTGKPGSNKAHDTVMENLNKESKPVVKDMNTNLDAVQLEKDILSSNIRNEMVRLDKEVNNVDGGLGGGHADKKVSEEALEDIKEEISVVKPFCHTRKQITYKQRIRTMWSGTQEGGRLSDKNIHRFVKRNQESYEEDRARRPF